jgi:hypothetical protein
MIWYGNTSSSKAIDNGDEYRLPAGAIQLSID